MDSNILDIIGDKKVEEIRKKYDLSLNDEKFLVSFFCACESDNDLKDKERLISLYAAGKNGLDKRIRSAILELVRECSCILDMNTDELIMTEN